MDVLLALQKLIQEPTANEELKKHIAAYLNHLLVHDFAALVQLLYRVDVPEQKLKTVLQQNPGKDAGDLIAGLLIARQEEKQWARQQFRPPAGDTEERW